MFRTVIAATLLAAAATFLLTSGAAMAKGPFSLVLRGGDLTEPVTIKGPIDDVGMFGPEIDDPLPHPDVIYTVEFFTMDEGRPAGTISYYPAHDGLPAAWRTSYGFYAVPDEFNASFVAYLPGQDDGRPILWYVLPGVGLGLAVVAGAGLAGRAAIARRRA